MKPSLNLFIQNYLAGMKTSPSWRILMMLHKTLKIMWHSFSKNLAFLSPLFQWDQIESKPSHWKKLQPAYNALVVAFFILSLSSPALAQEKKGKLINIKNADWGYYEKKTGKNRLLGNVILEHEGALMYCDSAWRFSKSNEIQAFENVYLNQGDTIELWGDYLEYSGNTKIATVTGKEVRLKDKKMELITDRLKYDRNNDQAYYYTG